MRKLTLVVEIDQPEANWLWEAHRDSKLINGVKVDSIADGNALKELSDYLDELDNRIEDLKETLSNL